MEASTHEDIFEGRSGELIIVDPSNPMLSRETTYTMFEIALSLFVNRTHCRKVIALDEAHAYISNNSPAATILTQHLFTSLHERRHHAVRVVIATQKPTINTTLLELCSISVVHRFSSLEWYLVDKQHIAGAGLAETSMAEDVNGNRERTNGMDLFSAGVRLPVGEPLLVCPTAALKAPTA